MERQHFDARGKQTGKQFEVPHSGAQPPTERRPFIGSKSPDAIRAWLRGIPTHHTAVPEHRPWSSAALDEKERRIAAEFQWTTVTSDRRVLDHLFQLYFSWVHPVHTIFSEGHFVDSYLRQSDEFCSSVLVNSVCAMACHLCSELDLEDEDFAELGKRFFDAVCACISTSEQSLTTIQSLAILGMAECARGRLANTSIYLGAAAASLLSMPVYEQSSPQFGEVLMNTRRGVRCLTVEWAQITSQPLAPFSIVAGQVGEINEALDDSPWYQYRHTDAECPAWPSLIATTNREKSKLIKIIDEATRMLHNQPLQGSSAGQILQEYKHYLAWREQLPDVIDLSQPHMDQFVPHLHSLLILYSASVVQLLKPMLSLPVRRPAEVRELIWQNIREGFSLLNRYSGAQYRSLYQPVFQMFSVYQFYDVALRHFSYELNCTIRGGCEESWRGMKALSESQASVPVGSIIQKILFQMAKDFSVCLPVDLMDLREELELVNKRDDITNSYGRLT